MRHVSPALARQISVQHGIVCRSALISDGFSRDTVGRLVANGLLAPIHQGVYRVPTAPDTFEARCVAACLADPAALITGLAAGRLWAFRHVTRIDVPEVLVAHHSNPMSVGVTLRRTNQLHHEEIVQRRDGSESRVHPAPGSTAPCTWTTDTSRC